MYTFTMVKFNLHTLKHIPVCVTERHPHRNADTLTHTHTHMQGEREREREYVSSRESYKKHACNTTCSTLSTDGIHCEENEKEKVQKSFDSN